ncbi:hypothetical protein BO71DRAFT_436425 [Aspergillus ellipticus CBS 707.79]|uniref:C2H2-type domain-containing protein n=1 Tax=Aspergillus ellipticus CBS 707.79 TaxID=1448320 RepID=A0A319CSR0_9EURO|nr:hypothetical protein BO71DRAFT_436425 [Aspergillus ellipticus CBS 707.79]
MAPGNARDFNCSWEQCGKSFNRKSDLCRHFRIHTNERPYHCMVKDCNKSFIQRSALTVHSRTHTGEKPHVCDHRGCQKAFSDSSSLARHRRIHTGRRPYICHEPTCERSFCRKTTLTKHQNRSHPRRSMTRLPSEDEMSEHSYQAPVAVTIAHDQYFLAQQPFYPHTSTPTHEFYSQIPPVPAQQPSVQQPPLVTHHIPVTSPINVQQHMPVTSPVDVQHHIVPSPIEVQRAQQQYMQLVQQRYDPTRQGYLPPEFQQPYNGVTTGGGAPLMLAYDHEVKPTRMLDQPEGTDWRFLGIG